MTNWKVKRADILEMAKRRAKRSEIWDPGEVLTCTSCTWGTFDLLVFKVILVPFIALVSKLPVTRKRLGIERHGLNFGAQGYLSHAYVFLFTF